MITFFDHFKQQQQQQQQQQQALFTVCYSPTNAQVIILKRILKFTLK